MPDSVRIDHRVVAGLREQARRYQGCIARGAGRVGWKIGLNIPEVEDAAGEVPVVGHLTTDTSLSSGDQFNSKDAGDLRVECEVVLKLAGDIVPDEDPPDVRKVLGPVAVGLELVDVGRDRGDLGSIISNNLFHLGFAVGSFRSFHPGELLISRCRVNGKLHGVGETHSDFTEEIVHIARQLDLVDLGLQAGDWIFTGAQTHVAAVAGDQVEVEISGLGHLAMSIE